MTTPKTPDLAAVVARVRLIANEITVTGSSLEAGGWLLDGADIEALCAAAERVAELERDLSELKQAACLAVEKANRMEISVELACGTLIGDLVEGAGDKDLLAHSAVWRGEDYDVIVQRAKGVTLEKCLRAANEERDAAQADLAALRAERDRLKGEPEHVVLAPDGDLILAWNRPDGGVDEVSVDAGRVRAVLTPELAALRSQLAAAQATNAELIELLGYMRIPLENARKQIRPYDVAAQPGVNVTVNWTTGSDTVKQLLSVIDAASTATE